jgi:biotin transport system substrate-specific component
MQTALRQVSGTTLDGFTRSIPGKIVLGLAATLVVTAAAHVSFPLWFTPVPLTLQPLAVLCVGLALGPVTGFLAMLAYLLEGALGLPVFSPIGLGGMAQIAGPTGGYLMAYPVVAFMAGAITRRFESKLPRFVAAAIACTVAIAVLFVCGAGWLMSAWHYTAAQAWVGGIVPFAPGEAIKIIVAAGLYSSLARYKRA